MPFEPTTDAPTSARPAAPHGTDSPSIGALFARMTTQVTTLVRGEIELTTLKARAWVSRLAVVIGAGVAALVLALYLVGWLLHSLELALTLVLPHWASALIVSGVLLVAVLVCLLVALRAWKSSTRSVPDPVTGITDSVDAFAKGLGK